MASDGGDSTATKATGLEHAAARQPRTALLEPLDPAPAGAGAGAGAANTPSASSAAVAPYATPIGSDSGYHTDRSIIQGRGVSRPATPDDGGGNGSSQRQSPRTSSFGGAVAGAYAGDEHGEEVKLNMPMISAHDDHDIVVLRNVHKTYLLGIEGVPALRGVSLTIKRGEFVVILGKSGSGKTTMLNVIGTIDVPTRGDLYLCGTRVTPKTTDYDLARTRLVDLGFVFQTFNLLPAMTAAENVEMPMVLAGVPKSTRKSRAKELLQHVGMGHRYDHTPAQMSGGEQQRVTIARALSNRPKVLLLDEPTGDLDTVNSNIVMRIITDLNEHEKTTMIMVTHDVALRAFAHRVVHMLDGKIQRIETVPTSVRERALRELRAVTKQATDGGTDAGNAKLDAAAARKEAESFTSVRKPGFYSNITA